MQPPRERRTALNGRAVTLCDLCVLSRKAAGIPAIPRRQKLDNAPAWGTFQGMGGLPVSKTRIALLGVLAVLIVVAVIQFVAM